ncbi:MAG: hypothetical protein ACI9HH_005917, partial [Pseudomonadota bacterium]
GADDQDVNGIVLHSCSLACPLSSLRGATATKQSTSPHVATWIASLRSQ